MFGKSLVRDTQSRKLRRPRWWTVLTVSCVGSLAVFGQAKAELGEQLATLGNDLAVLGARAPQSGSRTLSLNGLEFEMATGHSALGVQAVLEQLESVCLADDKTALAPDVSTIFRPKASAGVFNAASFAAAAAQLGVLRWSAPTQGVIACLDPAGRRHLSGWLSAAHRAAGQLDVTALGRPRVFVVRSSATGTDVLAFRPRGALNVREAFRRGKDVPGLDPAGFPRLAGLERRLSAREHGAPYSVTSYASPQSSPRALISQLRERLLGEGFELRACQPTQLTVSKKNALWLVSGVTTSQGESQLTVIELGGRQVTVRE